MATDQELYEEENIAVLKSISKKLDRTAIISLPESADPDAMKADIIKSVVADVNKKFEANKEDNRRDQEQLKQYEAQQVSEAIEMIGRAIQDKRGLWGYIAAWHLQEGNFCLLYGFGVKDSLRATQIQSIIVLDTNNPPEDWAYLMRGKNVFNLEVGVNHNYFADGILVHNCHHAASDGSGHVLRRFGVFDEESPTFLVGCTATEHRLDNKPLQGSDGKATFQRCVYKYHLHDAIADGWLCDLRGYRIKTGVSLDGVSTRLASLS